MPTVKVLKEQAKAKGIKNFGRMTKEALEAALGSAGVETKSPPKVKKGEFKGTKFFEKSVTELREMAKDKKIKNYYRLNKAQLQEALGVGLRRRAKPEPTKVNGGGVGNINKLTLDNPEVRGLFESLRPQYEEYVKKQKADWTKESHNTYLRKYFPKDIEMIKVKDPVTGERTVHKKHTTIGFDKQYTNEFGTFIEPSHEHYDSNHPKAGGGIAPRGFTAARPIYQNPIPEELRGIATDEEVRSVFERDLKNTKIDVNKKIRDGTIKKGASLTGSLINEFRSKPIIRKGYEWARERYKKFDGRID